MNSRTDSKIITFYSYKGGTGRSMAVANSAYHLARKAKVLAIDWDLDAPGLLNYFASILDESATRHKPGVVEFFTTYTQEIPTTTIYNEEVENIAASCELSDYLSQTSVPNLWFMNAGRLDSTYSDRALAVDWQFLHERHPLHIRAFATALMNSFDYVLIDSWAGFSDISGICTALLPEKLVVVFSPNRQNLQGARAVAKRAVEYRRQSTDLRPLTIFPLVSRIDTSEPSLFAQWRFAERSIEEPVNGYQRLFELLCEELYALDKGDPSHYFDEVQIQHVPRYSYGEEIALRAERSDRLSLSRSYIAFSEWLLQCNAPWESPTLSSSSAAPFARDLITGNLPLQEVDEKWFDAHFESAHRGLKALEFTGFNKFTSSLLIGRPNATQPVLLDAARVSRIHAFGWPIGFVAENREDLRPRPTSDGIVAQASIRESMFGPLYDYWTLRRNGYFFMLQSLFEHSKAKDLIFVDTRIVRLTEAVMYCSRIYKRLGVPDTAIARLSASWGGLRGRKLGTADPRRFMTGGRETIENCVTSNVEVPLARVRLDLVGIVKELLDPLFVLFDFVQLSDSAYNDIVTECVEQAQREVTRSEAQEAYRANLNKLRLSVERSGTTWASRVYDMSLHITIFETATENLGAAKLAAVTAALVNVGGSRSVEETEQLAKTLTWERYTVPI